jgi:phosphate uptake regulator
MEARYLKDALHAKEQALAKTTAALDAAINEMHYPIARKCVRWGGEVPSRSGSGMLHAKNGEIDSDEEEYLEEDVKGSSKHNRRRSGRR